MDATCTSGGMLHALVDGSRDNTMSKDIFIHWMADFGGISMHKDLVLIWMDVNNTSLD